MKKYLALILSLLTVFAILVACTTADPGADTTDDRRLEFRNGALRRQRNHRRRDRALRRDHSRQSRQYCGTRYHGTRDRGARDG